MKKVATIMSVYKNDKLEYLKDALKSLYDQTKKVDIFIQLDGIVPKEIELFLDQELNDNKIFYLGKRDKNLGLSTSLNDLLKVVLPEYDYIVRMDADDISVKNRVQKQIDFLEQNSEVKVVAGWIEEFNMDNGEKQVIRYGRTHKELKYNMMKRNPLAHVTVCFRNNFFELIPSYDTKKLNEDFDLWIRAFKKGIEFYCLEDVLVKVRTNNDFFARRKNFKRAQEVMLLKFDATKNFGFGIKGYFYAVAHFVLFLLPSNIKIYLYKNMRN